MRSGCESRPRSFLDCPSVCLLCEHVFVPRTVSFTKPQLEEAVAASSSYAEALRRIGLRPAGGNHKTIRTYVQRWDISVDHFGHNGRGRYPRGGRDPIPLEAVLVEDSTYSRSELKRRLYESGLKNPRCELCGQTEMWRDRKMSMVLDHINGNATDNRITNLRMVCPNCNATLDTHCGRNKPRGRPPVSCEQCGGRFRATARDQRFCSRTCSTAHNAPLRRLVSRPPLEELLELVGRLGYLEVGRRFGVSDNAIRKWISAYGVQPPPGRGREPKHSTRPQEPPRLERVADAA